MNRGNFVLRLSNFTIELELLSFLRSEVKLMAETGQSVVSGGVHRIVSNGGTIWPRWL